MKYQVQIKQLIKGEFGYNKWVAVQTYRSKEKAMAHMLFISSHATMLEVRVEEVA